MTVPRSPTAMRSVVFREGRHDAPVFARSSFQPGTRLEGPAVIEEVSATTVLYPGDRARVHETGALLVECGR